MMKSPFPGMDPYLERHWLDVHASFAIFTREQLRTQMPTDLVVRVEEYLSISSSDEKLKFSADVRVHHRKKKKPSYRRSEASIAVAEPLLLPIEVEPATLRSVRILDTETGDRIVTAIEFLSPANKSNKTGRRAYMKKRRSLLKAGANLVEIDLIRQGGEVIDIDWESAPDEYREPYRICVIRLGEEPQVALYKASFKERLPTICIPLREKDDDAILDIQKLVDQAYEGGQYGGTLNYSRNPYPPLSAEDAAWTDQLLREKKLR